MSPSTPRPTRGVPDDGKRTAGNAVQRCRFREFGLMPRVRFRAKYGLQVMCEGGGMAHATLIERI